MRQILVAFSTHIRLAKNVATPQEAMLQCFGMVDERKMTVKELPATPKSMGGTAFHDIQVALSEAHKARMAEFQLQEEIAATPEKNYEIKGDILTLTLESGAQINFELFVRPGQKGPQISASSSFMIQPESSNRVTIICEGKV